MPIRKQPPTQFMSVDILATELSKLRQWSISIFYGTMLIPWR